MPRVVPFLQLVLCILLAGSAGAESLLSETPLTDQPGDATRGLAIIRDPSRASCLICHSIASLPDKDQGGLGPPLDGVAEIYDAGQLRQRIIDARRGNPITIMPPYFTTDGLFRVGERWEGQTIYTAQDVEDVVAFLLTLKD